MKVRPTPEMKQLLRKSGSPNRGVALASQAELAKALEIPLRQGVMSGDILEGIFEAIDLEPGATPEFPLDWLAPGTEKDHVAYTIPNQGRIPERHVEGDFVMVPTFDVGSSVDWHLKYARDARWDIVSRAMQVLESSFTKKMNDDGWHTLLAAGVDRNIVVFDSDANVSQFTKRLVSLMKTTMRRNSGGNSTSINRGQLTDLYMSPENIEDMRDWGVDIVDEITRREIFVAEDGTLNRVFSVNLRGLDELGEDQEYQNFFTSELAASLASGDVELVVGLDLSADDSFVMPVRAQLQIFEDEMLHRQRRAGLYGWMEHGFGVLDNRRVLLGSS